MKTEFDQSPSIDSFLRSVEREAAVLPVDRKRELLSDLGEHIKVALAERPGQEQVILAELGDPRAIVGTALESVPAADRIPRTPATPGAVKALRILLWFSLALAVFVVVGLIVEPMDYPVYVMVLSLLPIALTAAHVFFLKPGREALRITLTVTSALWVVGLIVKNAAVSPWAVAGALIAGAIVVLVNLRSTRTWLAGAAE
ncbi:HAAS signaling domain-containing protein [Streptomyces sp. NPDC102360]|uniref:HAAS signaling domain-containing protein n=1 Tax=Streptomyces sp. NPDC102360 TaxID=3366160 RepID=UPI003812F423